MRSQQHLNLTHLEMAKHKLSEQLNMMKARKIPSECTEIMTLLVAIQQPFLSLLKVVWYITTRGALRQTFNGSIVRMQRMPKATQATL